MKTQKKSKELKVFILAKLALSVVFISLFLNLVSLNTTSAFSETDLKSCGLNVAIGKQYCSGLKNGFECKQDLDQIVSDFKYMYDYVKNKDPKAINDKTLYKFIETYNYLDAKKVSIIKNYDDSIQTIDNIIKQGNILKQKNDDQYIKYKSLFDQSLSEYSLVKTDLQNLKVYCQNEAETDKSQIFDLVPPEMKDNFKKIAYATNDIIGSGKQTIDMPSQKDWLNVAKKLQSVSENPTQPQKTIPPTKIEQPDNEATVIAPIPEIKKQSFVKKTFNELLNWLKKIF